MVKVVPYSQVKHRAQSSYQSLGSPVPSSPTGKLPLFSAKPDLPSHRPSPPLGQNQIILLDDKGTENSESGRKSIFVHPSSP